MSEPPLGADALSVVEASLTPAGDGDRVADVPARFLARPTSTDEVSAVLRLASNRGWTVVARGTGSKLRWGRPPERVDVLLDVSGLTGIVDHAAGDLVVRVRAGTRLDALSGALSAAGQRLALTTRLAGQVGALGGSVGGTIAANPSGPLRQAYGTVRDLLIGITVVRADGTIASAGGSVVKNVAGYDIGKLMVGSLGTLGVITEAVFRLHPIPESFAVISVEVPASEHGGAVAGRLANALHRSPLVPAAVEINRVGDGPASVTVLIEGVAAGVPARADAVAALLTDTLLSDTLPSRTLLSETLPPGAVDVADEVPSWWYEPAATSGDVSLRIAVAPTGAGPMVDAIANTCRDYGLTPTCRGALSVGVLHVGLPGNGDPHSIARIVEDLRTAAARHDGTVVVEHAPGDVHLALAALGTDAFGAIPAIDLMRRLKSRFDPDRLLSPGRQVGGI